MLDAFEMHVKGLLMRFNNDLNTKWKPLNGNFLGGGIGTGVVDGEYFFARETSKQSEL